MDYITKESDMLYLFAEVITITTMTALALALVCVMPMHNAEASLAGSTYNAFANDTGTVHQINTTGSVSSGPASASVFDNSMYAGYTGPVSGSGAGAAIYWTAPTDTTFHISFDYTITNPYGNNRTSFEILGLDLSTYATPFDTIINSGSGHFDQTFSLLAGQQLSIMANAVGPDGNGGLAVNLTNLDVTPTPIPAAAWLLGSGLIGLLGLRKKEKV